MGLFRRLLSGKIPAWASRSTHTAQSAADLVAALERYAASSGAELAFSGDAVEVRGPRGRRTYQLHEFVFLCPADAPETWERMLSIALRDVIPDPSVVREARASCERILARARSELEALSTRQACLEHLRVVLRLSAFRAEVPDLVSTVTFPALDRFEGVAVYDFLPQLEGVPTEHVIRFHLSYDEILLHARDGTFATATIPVELGLSGPFAGSRIVDPPRIASSGPHGLLLAAPHRDLLLLHPITDASVVSRLDAMATHAHEEHAGGPPGGTGRNLFWWRSGVFREIPTRARAIVRPGQRPYEPRPPDQFRREVLKALGAE